MALVLEGIKVVETASVYAAPMAGRILADFGADVIHIENAAGGDLWRGNIMPGVQSDINYGLQNVNRNKRGMTLDLSQDGGREIIYRLLEKADVFLSNFRPRELEKFRLEYETLVRLNPRLICANLTGYGKKGPDRNMPGFEHTGYFVRSGMHHVISVPGTVPLEHVFGTGDSITGMALALGVMTALLARERMGIGQQVDVALFQMGVFALSHDIAGALVTGQDRQQLPRKDVINPVSLFYQTKDGRWFQLAVTQPDLYWSRICRAIGREDLEHDPRFASDAPRRANHAALFSILDEVFRSKTLDEWRVILGREGLPWAPMQNLPEVISDPQARANDFFVPFEHPVYGRIEEVANPINLSKTPATIRMPAPEFSQHTEEILLELGYTWEDIERFKQQGVIA